MKKLLSFLLASIMLISTTTVINVSAIVSTTVTYPDGYTQEACNHLWNTYSPCLVATSANQGIKTFTCDLCHETREEVIPLYNYLAYTENDKSVTINKYLGEKGTVEIPSKINDKAVTKVDGKAFEKNSNITKVSVPDSVVTIGGYAFSSCEKLYSVSIGKGLKTISEGLFFNCPKLKTLTLPDNIITIKEEAFNCGIGELKLGKAVKNISAGAFCESKKLKKVTVNKNNKYYTFENGVLYNKNKTKIVAYLYTNKAKKYTTPKTVKTIGPQAFKYNNKIEILRLSNNLKTIGSHAFCGCQKLKDVAVPSNVKTIAHHAFNGCYKLKAVEIKPNKKRIIEDSAFWFCKSLKSVTVPKTTGDKVFYNCINLKKITISKYVKTIGKEEFFGCVKLKTVTIPKTVKKISKKAFGYYYDDHCHIQKVKGFTIKGKKNTAAYRYAKKHGFKFVQIS